MATAQHQSGNAEEFLRALMGGTDTDAVAAAIAAADAIPYGDVLAVDPEGAIADVAADLDVIEAYFATPTEGDILYYDGAAWVQLAAGDDDDVLTLASGVPTWAPPA